MAAKEKGLRREARIRWVRPAQQARSQETQDRILDSAEQLLADKCFDDIPVAEIARRAGFSVGALYARFRDKAALLHCLLERFGSEVRATADAAFDPARWEGASAAEIAEELVSFSVAIHRHRIGILREVLGRAYDDPEIGMLIEQVFAELCKKLQPLLLARASEIRHPEPTVAAGFACRLVLGLLKEAVLFGGPGAYGVPTSDERLARELTLALLGYLGVERPNEDVPETAADPRLVPAT